MQWEDDDAGLSESVRLSITQPLPEIIPWAEENIRLPKSVKSTTFKANVTPWIVEPIMKLCPLDLWTRITTLRKPVQTGGSVAGEVVLLYWLRFCRGFLQYNWPTREKFQDRWRSRVEELITNCPALLEVLNGIPVIEGEFNLGRIFFRMQGVFKSRYLDSDSVTHQLNEEVHDWVEGHLDKARGRFTASKLYKIGDISNAGVVNDQFDIAHRAGTMQQWEVRCPGCGKSHRMQTKWDKNKPQLGGLRYDADGCRVGHFAYNYTKLRPTIEYQFPCGFRVHNEDATTRRALSDSGAYSEPTNPNTDSIVVAGQKHYTHRSYSYDAVIDHSYDWMLLIQQKHQALAARSAGHPEKWIKYTQERECIPYNADEIPVVNVLTVKETVVKTKEGLPDNPPGTRLRAGMIDRQLGERSKGELPYWWLLIRDYKAMWGQFKSKLLFEGRCDNEQQVVATLREHGVEFHHCCADSGWDANTVYQMCMRYGINCIKGGGERWYTHEDGAKRVYGPERPLHLDLNCPALYPYVEEVDEQGQPVEVPDEREPMFWMYSKSGIAELHHWMRSHPDYEVPSDVSEDYIQHHDAEERLIVESPTDGSKKIVYFQRKRRNDLLVLERYGCMMWNMAGLQGDITIPDDVEMHNETK